MVIKRIVKKCGNSGHVVLPVAYLGKLVQVTIEGVDSGDDYLTESETIKLINKMIEEAKRRY